MATDWTGTLLVGRYRLGRRVGGGGMGAVHEARDERVGRRVAVKVLHPQLARERQHVLRFLREAKAAAGLLHPHIVQVLDVSGADDDGPPFLVMEFLSGQSLARIVKDEKALAPGRVARLARQLLSALGAAHAVGIVHRDMKPGNIIVQRGYDGREITKIVDFGIAKLMDSQSYTRLTATGEILGTPAFMAPEQVTGGDVDIRADLYGVGAIIYDCIAGEPAVGRGPLTEIAQRVITGDHTPLAQRVAVNPMLSDVVERSLAVDPDRRFSDAAEMSQALAPYEDPTDAVLVPERRQAPPATRVTPSVRPAAIPQTSERPPEPAAAIPKTGERPRRASGPAGDRVPAGQASIPATSERPPKAIPITTERPPARAPVRTPRRGLVLAVLAFVGSFVGAGVVAAYVIFAAPSEAPRQPPTRAPVSTVPATPAQSSLEPMMPSTQPVVPAGAAVAIDAAAPDDATVADVGSEDEEPRPARRRRRRSRRRRMSMGPTEPPAPSDQPIYEIPPERVLEVTTMGEAQTPE